MEERETIDGPELNDGDEVVSFRCCLCGHVSATPFGCCAVCRRNGTARRSNEPPRQSPVLRRLRTDAEKQQEKRASSFDRWFRPAMPSEQLASLEEEEGDETDLEAAIDQFAIELAVNLRLPPALATQCIALLSMRGMGKTYTESVLFEELARLKIPVVAIDPVGAMWGLTRSADGEREGLDIDFRGGEAGDEFTVQDAEAIAKECIEPVRPVLLDLSHMVYDDQCAFMTIFLEQIFFLKRKAKAPMHLIIDEADLFAPQQTGGDEIQKRMRRSMEQVVRRGRIRGLGVTLATQRPSVIHKNVLSQTQVLVALRMTSPQDREAIDGWVRANGDQDKRVQLLETLPSLAVGEAWFWSPGWPKKGKDIFRRVNIRKRNTFDSSKTPEVILERTDGLPPPPVEDDDENVEESSA